MMAYGRYVTDTCSTFAFYLRREIVLYQNLGLVVKPSRIRITLKIGLPFFFKYHQGLEQ